MKKTIHCLGYGIIMANSILTISILGGIIMFGLARFTFYEPNPVIIWTEMLLAVFGIAWFNWAFFKRVVEDE